MAMWKLCALTTFEILQFLTCILCQQKSYISKGAQPIFEVLASARRSWGWAFGRYVSGMQVFSLCNGKVKTLRINNIWNFATFNLYTVPANILYLQRYSTDFRNLCLSSKMFEGGHLGGKFQVRRDFTFAMAMWKLCALTTFEILHLSTCALCQQKSYISKDIQPIFEIFASARRCWEWAFMWKVWGVQVYYFCNSKVKTLRIDNIWNIATFNLYTGLAKIQSFQRYLTDFRNLCLSSKMLRASIWVESFKCAGTLRLQWQWEKLCAWKHLKFCHFQPVHCARKNHISPKVFNRFSKSFPQLEDVDGGPLGRNYQVHRYFAFAIARWKLSTSTTFEILPLSTCTICH